MTAWNTTIPNREKMKHESRERKVIANTWCVCGVVQPFCSSALCTGEERVGDGEMKWWRQHVEEEKEEEEQTEEESNICRKRETHVEGKIKRLTKTAAITLWRAYVKAKVRSMIKCQNPVKNERKDKISAYNHTSRLSLTHKYTQAQAVKSHLTRNTQSQTVLFLSSGRSIQILC